MTRIVPVNRRARIALSVAERVATREAHAVGRGRFTSGHPGRPADVQHWGSEMSALSPAVRHATLMNLADRMASAADQWPTLMAIVWHDPVKYHIPKKDDGLPPAPEGYMEDAPGFDNFDAGLPVVNRVPWVDHVTGLPIDEVAPGWPAVDGSSSTEWRTVVFGPADMPGGARDRLNRLACDAEQFLPPERDADRDNPRRPWHPIGRLLTYVSAIPGVEAWGRRVDHPCIWQRRDGLERKYDTSTRPAHEVHAIAEAIGGGGYRLVAWCAYLPSVFTATARYARDLAGESPPPPTPNGLRHPFRFIWGGKSIDLSQADLKYRLMVLLWNQIAGVPSDPIERTTAMADIWPDDDDADENFKSLIKNLNKDFSRAGMPLEVRRNSAYVWIEILP